MSSPPTEEEMLRAEQEPGPARWDFTARLIDEVRRLRAEETKWRNTVQVTADMGYAQIQKYAEERDRALAQVEDLRAALAEATAPHVKETWAKLDELAGTLLAVHDELGLVKVILRRDDLPLVRWLQACVESDAARHDAKYDGVTKGHTRALALLDRIEGALNPEPSPDGTAIAKE